MPRGIKTRGVNGPKRKRDQSRVVDQPKDVAKKPSPPPIRNNAVRAPVKSSEARIKNAAVNRSPPTK